jgi:hypothetical protein
MNARTLSLITGLVAGLATAPSALAVSGCTNSYLSGNYAMQLSGVSAPGVAMGIGGIAVPASMSTAFQQGVIGNSGNGPIAGAVRLTLDGSGNITGDSSENMAGQWMQGNVTGSYTVNTDCTFSLALTDASGNTENFGGVLVGQDRSAVVLQTDAGSGVSGTLKSVRCFCQTSDLLGTFGLQYAGATIGFSNSPYYSSVGVVSFDGQGNLTAAESRFSGGSTSQVQSIGTMTVNSDCSFTMALSSLSASGGAMNFFGIASANNKQLLIVQSDAATAVTGTMTSQ